MTLFFVWLLALPSLIALAIFILETSLGAIKLKTVEISGHLPETRILIPAHNESEIINLTLERLEPFLSAQVKLLVVADNCSDNTADLARQAGYEVIERFDRVNRGKGYALAFGRDHLRARPPECVIVFDADCEALPGSIEALSEFCVATQSVVQARYILSPDLTASPKVQISNFAFWLKNVVRQRGISRLRGASVLVGTGMAFPWKVFSEAPLATANIVEDLALGLALTRSGHAPVFLEQAIVTSPSASEHATLAQRERWEHGFLDTARSHGFNSLRDGLLTGNHKLFQIGLHLLVPPLALLLMAALATLVVLGFIMLTTGLFEAFATLAAFALAACALIFVNWLIEGRRWLSLGAMIKLPLYLVWKIPVYMGFARGAKVGWNRTERSDVNKER